MESTERFAQLFYFVLGGRLFALGLIEGADDLLDFVERLAQLSADVKNLVNRLANA